MTIKFAAAAIILAMTGSSAALAIQAPPTDSGAESGYEKGALGYDAIMQGDYTKAIAQIETASKPEAAAVPSDPAQLINLGLAHAKIGQKERAKQYYEAAMASRESFEVELADGRVMDTREAARRALLKLENSPKD